MENCTFCGLTVLKPDIRKHTQFHVEEWHGEDLEVKEGTINRSSSKNPSTRFTICSFTETEDSNLVIYPELHILPISSPYDAIILPVLPVKFCQPGFPACEIRFYRSGAQYLHHTSVREYILF